MNATAEVVSISERLSLREASDPIEQALNSLSFGKRVLTLRKNQVVFSQGEPADALYYIQRGKVKLVVVSFAGKEATLSVMGKGEFFGLGSLQQRSLAWQRQRLSNRRSSSELKGTPCSANCAAIRG
jgi:CRP-like cAMP-binding protein